jgi:predicted RNase H-like HicB family nuclease
MKNLEHYLSLNYHKTVTQDDEDDYIVEVQELPGCAADGKTPNEAFENLREAMKSWLASRIEAGLEVPEPRTEEDYSGRILVRMAKYLHQRLAAQSAHEGVSLNQHLVTLLADASARVEVSATRSAEVQYLPAERAFSLSYVDIMNTTLKDVTKFAADPWQANPLGNCQPLEIASPDSLYFWKSAPRSAQYNQRSAFSVPADKLLLNPKKSEA